LFGLLHSTKASAHPHVFINMTEQLLFSEDGKLIGISNRWTFDEGYSSYATQGVPKKADGSISTEALDILAKSNTEALEEFEYFTKLRSDGRIIPLTTPKDFNLSFDGRNLIYTITVPLKEPTKPGKITIIEIHDPTFFVSFAFDGGPNAASMVDAPSGCALTTLRPNREIQLSQNLGETFFNSLSTNKNVGVEFFSRIILACP